MLCGSCWWYMIVEVCLLISMFPATSDAQSAVAKWLTRFIWKVVVSFIRLWTIRKNNEPFSWNVSYTKFISCGYFEIIECQNVLQCRSWYDCQTHKLLRPNGWLGSFERRYCLLFSEAFCENWRAVFEKFDLQVIHVMWVLWCYMIVEICLLISMFPLTPDAQSAAAEWLTRFIWKVIFSFIRWRSIRQKRAVFAKSVLH